MNCDLMSKQHQKVDGSLSMKPVVPGLQVMELVLLSSVGSTILHLPRFLLNLSFPVLVIPLLREPINIGEHSGDPGELSQVSNYPNLLKETNFLSHTTNLLNIIYSGLETIF